MTVKTLRRTFWLVRSTYRPEWFLDKDEKFGPLDQRTLLFESEDEAGGFLEWDEEAVEAELVVFGPRETNR